MNYETEMIREKNCFNLLFFLTRFFFDDDLIIKALVSSCQVDGVPLYVVSHEKEINNNKCFVGAFYTL